MTNTDKLNQPGGGRIQWPPFFYRLISPYRIKFNHIKNRNVFSCCKSNGNALLNEV